MATYEVAGVRPTDVVLISGIGGLGHHEHQHLIEAVVTGDAAEAQSVAQHHFSLTNVTMEHSLRRATASK